MVPLELQRRAVPEERRFEARVTPQGSRESSRGEPRAGMTAETGSSEPARLGSALVQPDRGGPGRTLGRRAIALDRSRETGCAGTGCGRTAGRVRSADGAEHDCSRGVPRTWPPGSASRASRVGAALVSGSPPDRLHRTSARSGQGGRAVERVRGVGRPAFARVGAEAGQGLAASVTGWGRASGARRPGASRPVRWPVAIARGRGSSVRPRHRSSSPTGPAGGSRRDSPKGIGLIATTEPRIPASRNRFIRTLQSPEGDWADCDGILVGDSAPTGRGGSCNPLKGIGLIATRPSCPGPQPAGIP